MNADDIEKSLKCHETTLALHEKRLLKVEADESIEPTSLVKRGASKLSFLVAPTVKVAGWIHLALPWMTVLALAWQGCHPTPQPPAPGPVPPLPAPPMPAPPAPVDSLLPTLKAAFTKDPAADQSQIKNLAALYRQSANLAADPTQTTVKGLHDQMKAGRQLLIGESLPATRAAITAELNAKLPTSAAAALDAPTRALCAQQFTRIAALLEQLP